MVERVPLSCAGLALQSQQFHCCCCNSICRVRPLGIAVALDRNQRIYVCYAASQGMAVSADFVCKSHSPTFQTTSSTVQMHASSRIKACVYCAHSGKLLQDSRHRHARTQPMHGLPPCWARGTVAVHSTGSS